MKEYNVLYQIRTLEKLLVRTFMHKKDLVCDEERKFLPIPTPTQIQIMEYILINGETYQKDLEKVLNLRRATVSEVLQTMEKNNLIKRSTDIKDTRTKKVSLNPEAKKLFLEKEKRMDEIEKIITKGISKQDLQTFSKVIELMEKNIKEY